MSNELTVRSLGDAVKDKVRQAMMDAIPDEALQNMIVAEFKVFFEDKIEYGRTQDSPFKLMVREAVTAHMKGRITSFVEAGVSKEWDTNGMPKITETVKALAPAVLEGVMGNLANNVLSAMRNQQGRF